MSITKATNSSYTSIENYFEEDALLSINTQLKVLFVAGVVILSISSLALAGLFFSPLASFSHALEFLINPRFSTLTIGGGVILSATSGLFLYVRQQRSAEKLKTLFASTKV